MAQFTFCRHEEKALVRISEFPEIEAELLRHMRRDEYNKNGKPYRIDNIYLDNARDDMIRNSVAKPSYKEKLRIRCYAPYEKGQKVYFEIKRKAYGLGNKRRAALTMPELDRFLKNREKPLGLKYIDSQVLDEIGYILDGTCAYPKVYISYLRRAYFGNEDDGLRITVDTDILSRTDNLDFSIGSGGTPLLPDDMCLFEIKFMGSVPLWLAELMNRYSFRYCSFSKYGTQYKISTAEKINAPFTVTARHEAI